jgi:bromodomain-containing factor 1
VEQSRFCSNLHRKLHRNVASPFYKLVGTSTSIIRASELFLTIILCRLDFSEHPNLPQDHQGAHGPLTDAEEVADFKLIIRNCFQFNPAGTLTDLTGIELQRFFDDKWKNLPKIKPCPAYNDDMDVGSDDGEDSNQHRTSSIVFPSRSDPYRGFASRYCRDGESARVDLRAEEGPLRGYSNS